MYIRHHLTSAELKRLMFFASFFRQTRSLSVVSVPNLFLAFASSSISFHTCSSDDVLRTKYMMKPLNLITFAIQAISS